MTPVAEYENFDLHVSCSDGSRLIARAGSGAGEARTAVEPRWHEFDVTGVHWQATPTNNEVRLGTALFESLFHGDVRALFTSSQLLAESRGHGLRVRLRLDDAPGVAGLPWELCFDAGRERWVFRSGRIPLVRYLDVGEPPRPLTVTGPFSILAVMASPTDDLALDVEREWEHLQEALHDQVAAGHVVLHRLRLPTLAGLRETLRLTQVHALHFVGHGYAHPSGRTTLSFETEAGQSDDVPADILTDTIDIARDLRLVVLNCCEGAKHGWEAAFGGAAHHLVAAGIPAVIAMQDVVSDDGAIVFSRELYRSVSSGYPIDAATAEGRKALAGSQGRLEWALPVCFMRSPDGRIVEPGHAASSPVPSRGLTDHDWANIVERIARGYLTPIVGWEMSSPALPDPNALAAEWAEAHDYPLQDSADLAKVSQYVSIIKYKSYPKVELERRVKQARLDRDLDVLRSFRALAQLPLPVYLTTSPDGLLADALRAASREPQIHHCDWRTRDPARVRDEGESIRATADAPVLYHLHGLLYGPSSDPASVVLTEDDYFDFVVAVSRNQGLLPPVVTKALSGTSLALIGFSVTDWTFRILVRCLVAAWEAGIRGFSVAVQLQRDDVSDLDYVTRYLSSLFRASDANRLHIYWGTAPEFATEMLERWQHANGL